MSEMVGRFRKDGDGEWFVKVENVDYDAKPGDVLRDVKVVKASGEEVLLHCKVANSGRDRFGSFVRGIPLKGNGGGPKGRRPGSESKLPMPAADDKALIEAVQPAELLYLGMESLQWYWDANAPAKGTPCMPEAVRTHRTTIKSFNQITPCIGDVNRLLAGPDVVPEELVPPMVALSFLQECRIGPVLFWLGHRDLLGAAPDRVESLTRKLRSDRGNVLMKHRHARRPVMDIDVPAGVRWYSEVMIPMLEELNP